MHHQNVATPCKKLYTSYMKLFAKNLKLSMRDDKLSRRRKKLINRPPSLDIEAEVNHISVLHDVVFAFEPQLALLAATGFAA